MQTEISGMTRILLAAMLCCLHPFFIKAQGDTLVYINGEKLVGKLISSDDDELSFKPKTEATRGITVSEKTSNVAYILLESGQKIKYSNVLINRKYSKARAKRDKYFFKGTKIHQIKINLLALPFQQFELGYEKLLSPANALYLNTSFRHAISDNAATKGYILNIGYKRYLVKTPNTNSKYISQPQNGFFATAEIMHAAAKRNLAISKENPNSAPQAEKSNQFGIIFSLGYQHMISKKVSIESKLGAGQCFLMEDKEFQLGTLVYDGPFVANLFRASINLGYNF